MAITGVFDPSPTKFTARLRCLETPMCLQLLVLSVIHLCVYLLEYLTDRLFYIPVLIMIQSLTDITKLRYV